ncbi:MAG: hypothetical protein P1V19_02800 [Gimesia sp.]|nr:hypothetical protein [Gimesia sp.]
MKPRSRKVDKRQSDRASEAVSRESALWPVLLRAVGLGVGTVLFVMILLGATGQDEDRAGTNRKKIESMTSSERAQLKRNYEKFQKLSAQDKQRFREIHAATRNQPELNQVMRSYCNWVKTLSPWEQEDLRNAKTPQERMDLIRKFRSHGNQANRRGSRSDYFILRMLEINFRDPRMMFLLRNSTLPPDLYKEVIDLIERSLPRSVEYPKPKESLSEFERSLAVLKTATALNHPKEQENQNGSTWLSADVRKGIFELWNENKFLFRDSGEQRKPRPIPREENQQKMLSIFLAKGLINQLVKSVKQDLDQHSPSDDALQKFFETGLDTKAKDYLMKYPPDEMQDKLKYLYLQKNQPAEVRKIIKVKSAEFNTLVPQLFRGINMKGPGFENPFKRGSKDRLQNMKDRRKNGPQDRGDRPSRERKPGQGPLGKPRKRPDA